MDPSSEKAETFEETNSDCSTYSDEDSSSGEIEEEAHNLKGTAFYTQCVQHFNKPLYEDVTAMINSTVPTLVDGDALLMYAVLQDSHPVTFGHQFLHVTYVCERFLDVLMQKGANCVLVFFDWWEVAWEDNLPLRTLRTALYQHFKNNTTIRTYCFLWYYSPTFRDFKNEEKPRAILSDLKVFRSIENFNMKWQNTNFCLNYQHAIKLFASALLYCISNDLPIIDVSHVTVGVTLIHSFNVAARPIVPPELYVKCQDNLLRDIPPYRTVIPKQIVLATNYLKTTRDLILEAAAYFLKTYNSQNELRFLLMCYTSKSILSLEDRAVPKMKFDNKLTKIFQNIIGRWHNCLYTVLHNIDNAKVDFEFQHIADLWQGTLFVCIANLMNEPIQDNSHLGLLQIDYEDLVSDLNVRFCGGNHFNPYPLEPIIKRSYNSIQKEEKSTDDMVKLNKIDNPLIDKFCENIFDQVLWKNPAKYLNVKQFSDARHWHCRKPILDTFESEMCRAVQVHSSRKADREFQKQFRYYNLYGENLEGRQTQYETIIYRDSKEVKSKPAKQSKSSKAMQEGILARKVKEASEEDTKKIKEFKENMNTAGNIIQLKDSLYNINNIIKQMSCAKTVVKASLLKLRILKAILSNETRDNKISSLKEIFLLIRTILRTEDEGSKLIEIDEKSKKFISKLLHLCGFGEIAQRNNLLLDKPCQEEYQHNWVRFQLEHLGADLLRETGGSFDPDVNFTPDEWQAEFIEAIRHNESALVVAPTSSGKTFACYYCMKRVLQYSSDGIVIYVAPTKALVNQVAATVTHRFKKVKLPENGTALVGVFTRDHRRNPSTSRILITVPQCLDILLMSPQQYNWNKKVKYVIFDEVHRLSGNEEGLVWERLLLMIRCPFLALSATISDANLFYKWLQTMEHFKQKQDEVNNCLRKSYKVRCVIHEERHADLTKYVYTSGSLQHYHPYCTLHSAILLDRGKIPESITLSPKETLQLYDALSACAIQYVPAELDCLAFFNNRSESGFITRKSVREYEKQLGNVFYKIYTENFERYETILSMLTPPDHEDLKKSEISLGDGCRLLHHMADNNMLPAIVFSYNRKVVENFCSALMPKITSTEPEEKSRKERKTEKLKQKMQLRKKEKGGKEAALRDDYDDRWNLLRASYDTRKNPINILAHTGSKFKGIGIVDRDDLEFIETRLHFSYLRHVRDDFRKQVVSQLQAGLAYHHAGVDKKLRDTAEMLFRLGIVKVVVATGTLAVGVHMPCKSVVIFGDSPFLNSLEYHQMSGRAGRRGFDNEGNVIFLNLTKNRRDMLMADKLPKMLGNYPVNVSLVARLLLLVSGVDGDKISLNERVKVAISQALTLLENSLIFEINPHLKEQIKHFVGFAVQLLLMQQIIDVRGVPTPWCTFIVHLHYHEPANLALTYLIRCGALTDLVKNTSNDADLQWNLMVILCYLFTRIPLRERLIKQEFKNSVVVLDPLPKRIEQALSRYNKEVKFVFNECFLSIARYLKPSLGVDNTLPLSKIEFKVENNNLSEDRSGTLLHRITQVCYQRETTSAFVALSGSKDNSLHTHNLISNIRHEISPAINVVPEVQTSANLNGYALDFYRHGSRIAINRDNGLRQGLDYTLLNDFRLVLKSIILALEDLELEGAANERLLANFKLVENRYSSLFHSAYYFKR